MEPLDESVLETQINAIQEIEPISPTVFKCKDVGLENTLIKIHIPEEKTFDEAKQRHDEHIALLGQEFIEKQTPITITNPTLLEKIKGHILKNRHFYSAQAIILVRDANLLQGFVQGERETSTNLWDFIVKNHSSLDTEQKDRLITFLERMQEATRKGYLFDIPVFPSSPEDTEKDRQRNYNNCIVDKSGPTFIDTEHLWKADSPGNALSLKEQSLGIQIALDLLRGRVPLGQAFTTMDLEKQKLEKTSESE